MQVVSGLLSMLKRRSRVSEEGGEAAGAVVQAASAGAALQHKCQPCVQPKRRRLSAPAAVAAAAEAGAGASLPAGPLGDTNFKSSLNPLFRQSGLESNPLFSDDTEADAYSEFSSGGADSSTEVYPSTSSSTSEDEQENALLPPRVWKQQEQEQGPQVTSSAPGKPKPCGSGKEAAGNDGTRLAAFLLQLHSVPLAAALTGLELEELHPMWPFTASSSIAGLLVLCRRAQLSDEEMTPEVLLTLLWLLESASSQYRSDLRDCLGTYLGVLGALQRCQLYARLKEGMMDQQVKLLERCEWRVVLRDGIELQAAQDELKACFDFRRLCAGVKQWAEEGRLPRHILQGQPAAAAVAAAALAAAAEQPGSSSGQWWLARVLSPHNK